MVLRHRENKMASEQPLKKKQRRGDNSEPTDETDFIHNLTENGVRTELSALHLSLPPDVNEDDITLNTVNAKYCQDISAYRTIDNNSESEKYHDNGGEERDKEDAASENYTTLKYNSCENISMQPAPDIIAPNQDHSTFVPSNQTNCDRTSQDNVLQNMAMETADDMDTFQHYLVRQCLCEIPESVLRKPFVGHQITDSNGSRVAMLCEWPSSDILQFLSNLQLLFDVYLKQNNNGYICSRIVSICDTFVGNEHNLIEQIISLCESGDRYINYMAARVFSSFLIIAKTNINNEWLETIVSYLTLENIDYIKMNFALEVIKRVVEWKNVEIHVLEEPQSQDVAGSSSQSVQINVNCVAEPYSDAESYDTSAIKGLIIKSLESRWPDLIERIEKLIMNDSSMQAQICVLTFLALWESTISVKANLSVVDTKPFYAHLDKFVEMLNCNLPPIIWKQLLSLFNEVLCYGSTLALQDMLPEDTCQLAHFIVRFVKDHRLLDSIPYRRSGGYTVNSFVGTILSTQPNQSNIDRTLLQKMSLLVLKSAAITIKETRFDSSDSSVGSDDYDFSHDMQHILRSILDVLKKVDAFIKGSLEFHPETSFSKILVHLFSDQDDYMIEAMVCTLDIIAGIFSQNVLFADFMNMLNPILSFIEFLKEVSHDPEVLLDYLVSNETCFLLYLLRFLKYTRRNWNHFVSSCTESSGTSRTNELDRTMTVLTRLKMQIERLVSKKLFPYPIGPVLRLLEDCESLYENNEYS